MLTRAARRMKHAMGHRVCFRAVFRLPVLAPARAGVTVRIRRVPMGLPDSVDECYVSLSDESPQVGNEHKTLRNHSEDR